MIMSGEEVFRWWRGHSRISGRREIDAGLEWLGSEGIGVEMGTGGRGDVEGERVKMNASDK